MSVDARAAWLHAIYRHIDADIRDASRIDDLFARLKRNTTVVIHAAAQPSHDWAARDPHTDFTINANGTLNFLEATRKHCPEATFLFMSTNKVYGDHPNSLPLLEQESRWEVQTDHPYAADGINETMEIDRSLHSLFGASKVAADILVQEYGRYFGINTACFRGGCLTGPGHSGTRLHGFLAYLARCAFTGERYTVFGHKGKQVRDNIHAFDLVNALWLFSRNPRCGEVYNIGGGRHSNCSMLEAIATCETLLGRPMNWCYDPESRTGDHIWWISDVRRFKSHYPDWSYKYSIEEIFNGIIDDLPDRLCHSASRVTI